MPYPFGGTPGPSTLCYRPRILEDAERAAADPYYNPAIGPETNGRVDRSGAFTIEGLPAGPHWFRVQAPGSVSLKAVLVGGPTGGLLPPDALDTAYTFDTLAAAGAHLGSGSIVVADDRACIVDLARLLTKFSADSACGKSIPCRIGLRRLYEIGDRVAAGRPKPTDPQLLEDLAHDVAASALCDHERLATLPFTSAMRYFRSELDAHLLRSTCPAGVCTPIAVGAGATAAGSR